MAQSELDVYRNIVNTYKAAVKDDPRITALRKKLEEGGTKTESAWSYGNAAGEQMEKALLDNAQAIVDTEDGYNAVKKALKAGYDDVSEYSADVLSGVNQKAGIGMKGTPADFDDVRSTASAISNKISNAETVEECEEYIREEVKTFTNNAAGDTIRETAKMADSQGMNPKIERTAAAHACQYCADLSGSYVYPCDRSVFSRHANCDCTIEYIPVKGAKKIVSSSTYRQNKASMSPEERESRAEIKAGAKILQSGAKKEPGWRGRHAELYYNEIRNRKPYSDAKKIAKNIDGFTVDEIEAIRKHVFVDEVFRDGKYQRFDPDYEQAQVWQRLIEGKRLQSSDIVFLEHERMELNIMKSTGCSYEEAHEQTQKVFDWWSAHEEERRKK